MMVCQGGDYIQLDWQEFQDPLHPTIIENQSYTVTTLCNTKANENKKQISQDLELPLLQMCVISANLVQRFKQQSLGLLKASHVHTADCLPIQNHPCHWVLFSEVLEYEISFTDLRATLQPLKMMSKNMFTNQQCQKLRTENQ